MDFNINPGNINNIPADTYLAREGEDQAFVFMILKGRLALENGGCSVSCGTGSFVGFGDLASGINSSSVYVKEDSSVFAFPVKRNDSPSQILSLKKDYSGIAVWTLARTISDYDRLKKELETKAVDLSDSVRRKYEEYSYLSKAAGFLDDFRLVDRLGSFAPETLSDNGLSVYYLELVKQTVDNCKLFFGESPLMADRHVREETAMIAEYQRCCVKTAAYLEEAVYVLFNNGPDNLYMKAAELVSRKKSLGKDSSDAEELLSGIKDIILDTLIFFEQSMHYKLKVSLERMEEAFTGVLVGETAQEPEELDGQGVALLRKSLNGGAEELTEYAGWDGERAETFVNNVEAFVNSKNRTSPDESLRHLRHEIAKQFYDLYMDVFLKQCGGGKVSQLIDLFLNFGFVDQRLLSDQQLTDLCALTEDRPSAPCQVFTFREWLNLVYNMRRTPSKSELDMDFEDSLRDRKKRGEITEMQMTAIAKDPVQWVSYEVHNMFASNERLLNGQVTTFVPILHEEGLAGLPSRLRVSKDRVNTMVTMLTVNDPSLFHREIIYNDAAAKVEREPVMKRVYPEFVLFPVCGSNVVMWQETSSRKRDSAGRILLPVFFEGSAEDAMLRAFGRFRWELCKTVMGLSWNNIQVKSLTSEYYDYITYYRKNHDLSEERKEKIKNQLTKGRNNMREVFVQDYESWIKYESAGAVRLNRVAREILATYIPFSKTVRTGLESQPVFADAFARFERNLKKKQYDLDLHYKNLEKNGTVIVDELKHNKEFYDNI